MKLYQIFGKSQESVHSALRAASLTPTNIANFAHAQFCSLVKKVTRAYLFISSPPYRVCERLLLFKLKLQGYEICAMLRHSTVFRVVPIIMLTGKDGLIDRVRARMVGATDYLTKPLNIKNC